MAFKAQGHGQQDSIFKNNLHNKYQQKNEEYYTLDDQVNHSQ
jgi:hypothetical protein